MQIEVAPENILIVPIVGRRINKKHKTAYVTIPPAFLKRHNLNEKDEVVLYYMRKSKPTKEAED